MFNKTYLNYSEKDLRMTYEKLIKLHLPEGKTTEDYTGANLQILKSKVSLVLFFGYTKSNNPISKRVNVDLKEVDLIYLMMKAKAIEDSGSDVVNLSKMLLQEKEPDFDIEEWE